MFSFFKKKYNPKSSLRFLQLDMHNHVLPGVDDGAKNLDESLSMLRKYAELGWSHIVATPHINEAYYPNQPADLIKVCDYLKKILLKEEIPITLELAAEYQTDALFRSQLEDGTLLTFKGNRILIELPFFQPPLDWEQYFFDAQMKGFTPVLAHAERYLYWKKELKNFDILLNRGVELQLNLSSLIGKYGADVKDLAEMLIHNNAYQWVASDAHSAEDLEQLRVRLPQKWPAALQMKQYKNNVNYAY